jgi:hypothetical protein
VSVASLNRAHGEAELALALAAAGLAVIPVHLYRRGERWCKDPLIKDWRNRASADARMVQGWWRQFPFAVPGIVLARCGLVIVDADRHPGKPDGVAALAVLDGLPPHPVIATRGGGEHHYFRQPDPPISFGRWLGGEVLGTSKFAVAYAMIDPALAPALPAGLLRALPKQEARGPSSNVVLSIYIGEVEGATAALRKLKPCAWNGRHDEWFALLMGAKAAGVACDDFVDWSTQDPEYADDAEIIRVKWNSIEPRHPGAFFKALKDAGIKLRHSNNNNAEHHVPAEGNHSGSVKPSRRDWRLHLGDILRALERKQTEPMLFWSGCRVAEIFAEAGKPKVEVARGLLEGACPKLIKEIGIPEVRRTIANALANISNKTGTAIMKSSDIEQRERRELLGSTTTSTFHQRAIADLALEDQGRHTQGAVVTGSERVPQVPRQPEGSPWSGSIPEGVEPPLGYAINAQESVGEPFEVAASLTPLGDVAAEVAREEEEPLLRPTPTDLVLSLGSVGVSPSSLIRGRRL